MSEKVKTLAIDKLLKNFDKANELVFKTRVAWAKDLIKYAWAAGDSQDSAAVKLIEKMPGLRLSQASKVFRKAMKELELCEGKFTWEAGDIVVED
jgi:hypothetical protein